MIQSISNNWRLFDKTKSIYTAIFPKKTKANMRNTIKNRENIVLVKKD